MLSLLASLALVPASFAQTSQTYDAATLQKYDKNADGLMDAAEIDAMNREIAAGASGAVALNPFVVTSERDRGFRATSVGSGSRLNIDLADTPVAYSVINREMIDALGILNLQEAASWSTGSTYYATDNGGINAANGAQVVVRGSLNNINNSFDSTGSQRNFFQNNNAFGDSYTLETYDFGRGPNAALFGNTNTVTGGLAGIQSQQTKQARLDRWTTSITLMTDQHGSKRGTIDINKPISERIGLRVNGVRSTIEHYRFPDRQETTGLSVNLRAKLTPTTDLTFEGNIEKNNTHNVGSGYDEYISGWDGVTVFRGPITNAMLTTTATPGAITSGGSQVFGVNPVTGTVGLTFNGEPNGVTRLGGNFFVFNPYENTVMNYQNYPVTRRADSTSRVPLWSTSAPNGLYYQRASLPRQGNGDLQPSFGVGRMGMYEPSRQMLPKDMFNRVDQFSSWDPPSYRWTGTIDHPALMQWTKGMTLTLSQRFGTHMFLDVAGDTNKTFDIQDTFDNPNSAGSGYRSVTVDINMLKPDGTPNEKFLMPWSSSPIQETKRFNQDNAMRVNFAYTNLDLGRFGNYTFNLQGNLSTRKNTSDSWAWSMKQGTDPRLWGEGSQVLRPRINWDDSVRAYTIPEVVRFTNVDWTNANAPVILPTVAAMPSWVKTAGNGSLNFRRTTYGLAQTTARYFNNRVVFTGAFRKDQVKTYTKSAINQGDLPATWNARDIIFRPDAPADYFQLTYIQRNTSTGVPTSSRLVSATNRPRTTIAGISTRNVHFLNDRFRDDYNSPVGKRGGSNISTGIVWRPAKWISPAANYSNSYTPPSSTSFDMFGNVREPVKAFGWDMSVNLSLLNDNLTVKFNYFKNTRLNDSSTAPVAGPINSLINSNHYSDPDTVVRRNQRGITPLPGADYESARNDGREVDIAATPIRGWRITANGSWTFRSSSDLYPQSKTYVPDNAEMFRLLLEDAGGRLDTSIKPTPNAPGLAVLAAIPSGSPALDQQNAVNAYNNIWANFETVVFERQVRVPQQPTMNIFNDYTIQSGALKGLRIGAGLQWQGIVILNNHGNQRILSPTDPTTAVDDPTVDNFDYRFMKGSYRNIMTLGYAFQNVFGNPLTVNLRIDNVVNSEKHIMGDSALGGGTGFGGTFRQPEGNLLKPNRVPAPDLVSRMVDPRSWTLTATYAFRGGGR